MPRFVVFVLCVTDMMLIMHQDLGPLNPSDIADICDKFTSDFAPAVTKLLKQVDVSKGSFEAVDAEEELCSDITKIKNNIDAYTNALMEKATVFSSLICGR